MEGLDPKNFDNFHNQPQATENVNHSGTLCQGELKPACYGIDSRRSPHSATQTCQNTSLVELSMIYRVLESNPEVWIHEMLKLHHLGTFDADVLSSLMWEGMRTKLYCRWFLTFSLYFFNMIRLCFIPCRLCTACTWIPDIMVIVYRRLIRSLTISTEPKASHDPAWPWVELSGETNLPCQNFNRDLRLSKLPPYQLGHFPSPAALLTSATICCQ